MFPLTRWHSTWAAICGVTGLVAAVPMLRHGSSPAAEPLQVTRAAAAMPRATQASSPSDTAAAIYVHVMGEVAHPGLYRMPAGARVMDAVTGAGGGTANADLNLLNLATPLRDGQKLRVPRVGEAPEPAPEPMLVRADALPQPEPAASPPTSHAASAAKLRHPGDGSVRLNSAGEQDLQRLPGVGPSTAAKILAYRAAHGGFRTTDELMEVKGIGPKKLDKMRPFLIVP